MSFLFQIAELVQYLLIMEQNKVPVKRAGRFITPYHIKILMVQITVKITVERAHLKSIPSYPWDTFAFPVKRALVIQSLVISSLCVVYM